MSPHFCVWGLFVHTPVLYAQDGQPLKLDRGQNSKSPTLTACFLVLLFVRLKILLVGTCTDPKSRNFRHHCGSLYLCVHAICLGLFCYAVQSTLQTRRSGSCGNRLLRGGKKCLARKEPGLCQGLVSAVAPALHLVVEALER